ncbi:hypothetical protein J4407_03235 [Candidatus Pacearchaeota archaeon]|nr:hypothetical protein [Candidatus Pacearchaeota archaeon]
MKTLKDLTNPLERLEFLRKRTAEEPTPKITTDVLETKGRHIVYSPSIPPRNSSLIYDPLLVGSDDDSDFRTPTSTRLSNVVGFPERQHIGSAENETTLESFINHFSEAYKLFTWRKNERGYIDVFGIKNPTRY